MYSDKYTFEFENYCLENGFGERCNQGILLNKDVANAYMSILAEIISKETETDMITDNVNYADTTLKFSNNFKFKTIDRLSLVQKEIQFYVPYDMRNIPLNEFINLRVDSGFETARKNFVIELNAGNLGISLDTIKQHCSEAKEYATRI